MPIPSRQRLDWSGDLPPTLLVVVDTEEEFDWSRDFDERSRSVSNIALQPLAQAVFDRHGIIPAYVIDHPVATDSAAIAVLGDFLRTDRCEIGAHLHPWVNPPLDGPMSRRDSFPGNLPPAVERQKLRVLTDAIFLAFGVQPTIYKAGRYGVGPHTAASLAALGYTIDVSVVPYTSFAADAGPDFSGFGNAPFLIAEGLVELPLSVGFVGRLARGGHSLYARLTSPAGRRLRLPGLAARLGLIERLRLSPEGHTLADLQRQTLAGLAAGQRLFMLTYHSSSLLPGATAYVRTDSERSDFLAKLDGYFRFFRETVGGRGERVSRAARLLIQSPASAMTG